MTSLFRRKPLPGAGPPQVDILHRNLGWPQLIGLGVGAIVGTGIYTLIGVGAERAGPAIILAFALAGTVCALAALAYAELAAMLPQAGGAYSYSYAGMGEIVAWFVGWALVLEYSVACAAVAVGWSGYMVNALSNIGIRLPIVVTGGPHAGGVVNLPAVLIVFAVAAVLMQGATKSARLNGVLVTVKLAALALFVVLAAGAIRSENLTPFMPYGFLANEVGGVTSGLMTAAAVVFFAFFGFDAVATTAEEVKRPGRDLPIGIIGSIAICTLIYMIVSAAAVGAVPFTAFATDPAPLARIMELLGHGTAALVISAAAVIALPTVILVMMYGQTRVSFAMARDGLLPRALAEVDAKAGTPRKATAAIAIVIAAVAGVMPLREIAELTNAGTLTAFIAVALCVVILRLRAPQAPRPFRFPVAGLLAPLAAIGCAYLLFSLPGTTLVRFAIWNVVGLIIYAAYGRHNSELADSNGAARKKNWLWSTMIAVSAVSVAISYDAPWRK